MPTVDTINRRAEKCRNSSREAEREGELALQHCQPGLTAVQHSNDSFLLDFFFVLLHFCAFSAVPGYVKVDSESRVVKKKNLLLACCCSPSI